MSPAEPTRLVSLAILACAIAYPGLAQTSPRSRAEVAANAPAAGVEEAPESLPLASAAPSRSSGLPVQSVLILGDSLSDEKAGGGGYVRSLREHCQRATFDNRAKGGFMVNQMRRRLETEVLPEGRHYSHAIVFGGVNDLYSDQTAKRTLPRIQSDLSRIYEALAAQGTQVTAITVTPWGDFKRWYTETRGQNTLALNRWILEQPEAGKVAGAVDAYPLLSCGEPAKLCPELALPFKDGLHFGKLGHEKLASALLAGPFRSCAE
jgi:lysophospholipase L1-like esterase